MTLQEKYANLIQLAKTLGVQNLSITEKNNILSISGTTLGITKDQLFAIYREVDPQGTASDIDLKIDSIAGTETQTKNELIYVVKSGDSLSKIATKYAGITWTEIFEANKDQLKNPDLIQPGMKLRIPR